MKFETLQQRAAYEQVTEWMGEIVGSAEIEMGLKFFAHDDIPRFSISYGTSVVRVDVLPYTWEYNDGHENDALISMRAVVVKEADLNNECLLYLLRQNDTLSLGRFGVSSSNEIIFSHVMPISLCENADELATFLAAVVKNADEFDEQITEQWGGRRATDILV